MVAIGARVPYGGGVKAMITMRERIALAGITIDSVMAGDAPNGWPEGTASYSVTLTNADGGTVTTDFHMGPALCRDPEAAEVLGSLCSDAAGYGNNRSFEEWAAEYGYDADSRAAEKTYWMCGKVAEDLRGFLGDAYYEFLYETEE